MLLHTDTCRVPPVVSQNDRRLSALSTLSPINLFHNCSMARTSSLFGGGEDFGCGLMGRCGGAKTRAGSKWASSGNQNGTTFVRFG